MKTPSEPILHLKEAAESGRLVVVVGTGISMALTEDTNPALSWKGLIQNGFDYALTKGRISPTQRESWQNQLQSDDLEDLLSAADFMVRKLSASSGDLYPRWLENVFKDVQPRQNDMKRAIAALSAAEIPICTLNYDPLLERATGLPTIQLGDTLKVSEWMRGEAKGILHLHGYWSDPSSCILGTRDYESALSDDVRELIQRTLSSFNRLLFIGCGDTFADPNFVSLIGWLRTRMKTAALQHYALVKSGDVKLRHADPNWHGFVDPIGYGDASEHLPGFIRDHLTPPVATKGRAAKVKVRAKGHQSDPKVLSAYRAFILRDCGQMTIEGVRADLDTAQRRFDLERLFVPLSVLAVPPEIPISDPDRETKLSTWREQHKDPLPFGQVFKQHKRLALLALPGGGKTLLLKRLAVAYADPARRTNSLDQLPDIDIIPILVRCREWKAHITQPIITLIQQIPNITGQPNLHGLGDSLIPQLKSGKALILIDGLDEIHDDADRTTFVDNLEQFLADYPKVRLVVTSREAGFALVAPTLARFCQRWRVAPLDQAEISALCHHWHALMTGTSPEAVGESDEVAARLLENPSLRRLAENPLLLTMLLVVKHGAGRLPPDRVSLYERAVEVLLDTWNIKGHAALNPKEAVPQLAYVAYQLMKEGRQTATVRELLALLEKARDNVPQIRRYANDAPDEFLKRVELRSSLLVEAGFQLEGSLPVPFYQFRHLTFQEYLAAVASAEGHYDDYKRDDTVLTPIRSYLTADEWKEVVPMAAVLARKQAEPLIAALVLEGRSLRIALETASPDEREEVWSERRLPAPIARLAQCLIEEAEASSETLAEALQLIVLFAQGCYSPEDWPALSGGPYGDELLHQAWLLYRDFEWPEGNNVDNTYSRLAYARMARVHLDIEERKEEYVRSLASDNREQVVRALFAMIGTFWRGTERIDHIEQLLPQIEDYVMSDDPALYYAATWLWALLRGREQRDEAVQVKGNRSPREIRDRLLEHWLPKKNTYVGSAYAFALQNSLGLNREEWDPKLTPADREDVAGIIRSQSDLAQVDRAHDNAAALVVAFYDGAIVPTKELLYFARHIPNHVFGEQVPFEGLLEILDKD